MSEGGRTPWGLASAKGWRRSVRSLLAHVTPKHISKLEALRNSGDFSVRLEAAPGQHFGRVCEETTVSASGTETSGQQHHEQPAEAGTEE